MSNPAAEVLRVRHSSVRPVHMAYLLPPILYSSQALRDRGQLCPALNM